jgi:hypothetical protein
MAIAKDPTARAIAAVDRAAGLHWMRVDLDPLVELYCVAPALCELVAPFRGPMHQDIARWADEEEAAGSLWQRQARIWLRIAEDADAGQARAARVRAASAQRNAEACAETAAALRAIAAQE